MSIIQLDLGDDLTALLHQMNQPAERGVRELMVLELYRRGTISSGKAAQVLSMSRWQFIHYASQVGIPYFSMTQDEWEAERDRSATI